MRKGKLSSDAPFGTLLGYAPGGVAIYSSNYGSLDPRNYPEDADFEAISAMNTWATSGSVLSSPAVSCSSTTVCFYRCRHGVGDLLTALFARSGER
jgi:hypothetical protein